jgi:VWFA-related protein
VSSRGVLRELSEETGGKAYFPKESSELIRIYRLITDDLRNQYSLTYESPNETFDGRWVSIDVKAKRRDLRVRSRKGYFAAKSAS